MASENCFEIDNNNPLQVFGHQYVSVLDGGFPRWQMDDCPIAEEPPPNPAALSYTAKLREELVVNMNDVTDALQTGSIQVLTTPSVNM